LDGLLNSLLQMDMSQIEDCQKDILGKFPNSYSFSKQLGERLLKRHRGTLPLVVIRPSILGAAAEEPTPGWVDSITAGTAVFLTGSLGILKDIYGNAGTIGDQIPVDYVADLIIVTTSDSIDKNKLSVYH
jgi:hypothetical protein